MLIPASHNSEVDTPASLRERQVDPLGMLRQVPLQAGDALLVFSSTLHGMQPWRDTCVLNPLDTRTDRCRSALNTSRELTNLRLFLCAVGTHSALQ